MRRLKREIGYVIYIAVLLRERRALESFYMHFFACKYARFRRELRQRTVFVTLSHILKHIYPHVYKM